MSVVRVLMPKNYDGKRPPNPWRWACGYGHLHPSRKHAEKCVTRIRKQRLDHAPFEGAPYQGGPVGQ